MQQYRVLDGNIPTWHTGQLSTRTHPRPHWILGSPGLYEFRVSARKIQASGRQSGGSSALSTQLSQEARPAGIPRLDPEIPFGSLHLVSFSLVASTSLLFLPSGVHDAISEDVKNTSHLLVLSM